MAVIVKSPRAKRDLLEIWDYIADDSEARADAFIARFDAKLNDPAWAAHGTNWRKGCGAFRSVGTSSFSAPSPTASKSFASYTAPATSTRAFLPKTTTSVVEKSPHP